MDTETIDRSMVGVIQQLHTLVETATKDAAVIQEITNDIRLSHILPYNSSPIHEGYYAAVHRLDWILRGEGDPIGRSIESWKKSGDKEQNRLESMVRQDPVKKYGTLCYVMVALLLVGVGGLIATLFS